MNQLDLPDWLAAIGVIMSGLVGYWLSWRKARSDERQSEAKVDEVAIKGLQVLNESLQAEIARLQESVQCLNEKLTRAQAEIKILERRINELKQENFELRAGLVEAKEELLKLRGVQA